jgi:hypothetical protein
VEVAGGVPVDEAVADPAADPNEEPAEPAGPNAGPAADPGSGPDRAPRVRRGPLVHLAVAVLSGLLLTVLVAQVGYWVAVPPAAESGTQAASTDWARVVTDLDRARSRALAEGDPALLNQVYLPGSAAAAADAVLVEDLADRGLRVVDGTHALVSVEVLDAGGTDGTRLAVVDTLAARPVLDDAGRQVAATGARGAQRRVLVLAATDVGYRISAIEPG